MVGVRPVGRGPLSYLPEPGLLLAGDNRRGCECESPLSFRESIFRHGLLGVTSCNVCTGIYSSGEPYTHSTGSSGFTRDVDQVEDLPMLGLLQGCCLQPCPLQSL